MNQFKTIKNERWVERLQKGKTYSLTFSKVICPYCRLPVAPGNPEKVQTARGWAHYGCVLNRTAKQLSEAKLPKPIGCCYPWQLKKFLNDILRELKNIPIDSSTEKKLAVIMAAAEELGSPLKISKLVAEIK